MPTSNSGSPSPSQSAVQATLLPKKAMGRKCASVRSSRSVGDQISTMPLDGLAAQSLDIPRDAPGRQGQTIPLNFDPLWTQLSFDLANTVVWKNSLWFLDAQGKGAASFTMPPGYPGFDGVTVHHAVVTLNPANLASTFVSEPVAVKLY